MQKELSVSDLTKDDVAGHIAKPCYFDFWKTKLNAPEDVLESLIHGYKIPLFRQPPECELPHNASRECGISRQGYSEPAGHQGHL